MEFDVDEKTGQIGLHLVADNKTTQSTDTIRCYKEELKSINEMTPEELFSGFEDVKVITFSYDLQMIDWLMQRVKHAEIIIGADFKVRSDSKAASIVADALAVNSDSAKRISKYSRLVERMKNGDLTIHSSANIVDHRKLYLLHASDGRVRSIYPSANLSRNAWSYRQLEGYHYDDTRAAYDEYSNEFETSWALSQDIPYKVVNGDETTDPVEANAILKQVEETGRTVVLQTADEDPDTVLTNYQYVMGLEDAREHYRTLVTDTGIKKDKNGMIEIKPSVLEKIKINVRKGKISRANVTEITEQYPKLTFDYNTMATLLNDNNLPAPSEKEVRSDLDILIQMFNKYNSFVGTPAEKQQIIYYKLLTAMFASPFFARLRCEARLVEKGTTSLPLYLLLSSSHSNTGKTFFVRAVLKMMTGKRDLHYLSSKQCSPTDAASLQAAGCGVPLLVDEIDNRYLSTMKNAIKSTDQICEMRQNDKVPLLIFTSNDVTDPDMQLRKRMIFLDPEGTIPSDVDQTAWQSLGNTLIGRLGNGLYREYLARMIPKIWSFIEMMEKDKGKSLSDDWYPDIMPVSSEIIINIIKDYGYDVPAYFKVLTWKDDFDANASYIMADAFHEIRDLYKVSRKSFIIGKDTVSIEVGSDKANVRRMQSWNAVLPVEVIREAPVSSRSGWTMVLNKDELEKRTGIRFRRGLFQRG